MTRHLRLPWLLLAFVYLPGCGKTEKDSPPTVAYDRISKQFDYKPMHAEGFRRTAAAFSPDNKHLLIGHRVSRGNRTLAQRVNFDDLVLWDVQTGKLIRSWHGHDEEKAIVYVSYLPEGNRAVTASEDGTLAIWEMPAGKKRWSTVIGSSGTNAFSLSPDGM